MPKKSAEETVLEKLIADRDFHVAETHRIDALIAGFKGHLKGTIANTPADKKVPAPKPTKSRGQKAPKLVSPLVSKPLPEAVALQLGMFKTPKLAKDIWDALSKAGVTILSKTPLNAVRTALARRENVVGDVVCIGNGYWGMTAWYTAEELAEQKKKLGGMGGRDREEHVRRTKEGIANLMARGGRYGAVKKLTPEKIDRLRAHLAAGDTAKEACAKEEISEQSLYLLRKSGVPGLDRLKASERRRVLAAKRAANEPPAPDLLSPKPEGSMH